MNNHKKICDRIFKLTRGTQTEVIIDFRQSALTRFADNVISQNVSNTDTNVSVRLVKNGKMSKVNFNQNNPAEIKKSVQNAFYLLKNQAGNSGSLELLKPSKPIIKTKNLFFKSTAEVSPVFKALKIKNLVKKCKAAKQTCYGTLENGWQKITVANNLGLYLSHKESYIAYGITVKDKDGFGWAQQGANDINLMDFDKTEETARRKASLAGTPIAINPGKYTVILEPAAVADLLMFMNIYGFGGKFYLEGQSFISGKFGKKVLSDKISIYDNSIDGPSAGMPFDFEGFPRKKLPLIEKGVVKNAVFDRKTALEAKTKNTGHGLPIPNIYGPLPLNTLVSPGKTSVDDMIKQTSKGILITQFHYTNMLKPLNLEITGMTRNGTYLIENGKTKRAVKNMRFTESIVKALNNIVCVGDKTITMFNWGKISAPALKIKDFNFSSSTEF
ncbi:MAG: TldD/PmbA family protein [Elusimicrobia bacterium]|nr:TldD/PmbA family protein [Elusimicrobiota bacterium]